MLPHFYPPILAIAGEKWDIVRDFAVLVKLLWGKYQT